MLVYEWQLYRRHAPIKETSYGEMRALAPLYGHCGVPIIGYGLEQNGRIFCCDYCADAEAVTELWDHADEVNTLHSSAQWHIGNIHERLDQGNQPWRDYNEAARTLTAPIKILGFKAKAYSKSGLVRFRLTKPTLLPTGG